MHKSSPDSMKGTMKSCDYCRYRKKRCDRKEGKDKCQTCDYVGVDCIFSVKQQSQKRRDRSQAIAAKVLKADNNVSPHGTRHGLSMHADDQFYKPRFANTEIKLLFPEDVPKDLSMMSCKDKYTQHVAPQTPFLCEDQVFSPKLAKFIDICSKLSLRNPSIDSCSDLKQQVIESTWQMDFDTAIGIMLLAFRVDLDPELIVSATSTILSKDAVAMPLKTGASVANVWVRMLHPTLITIPHQEYLETFSQFLPTLEVNTLGYHYVTLTATLLRIIKAKDENDEDLKTWALIEQRLLDFPLGLTTELVDLRDEMPCTPNAIILHCFYNTVLLAYYLHVLQSPCGERLMLKPAPSVIHFLNALALTIFRAGSTLKNKWFLITECQALTASYELELLKLCQSDNCKRVLKYWELHPKFATLHAQVQQLIQGALVVEQLDGYSVFWTFRDLRSLCVERLVQW